MKSDESPIRRVLEALGIDYQQRRNQYSARCPSHDDSTASLSIGVKPDGVVGLHCHVGCDPADVCAALDLTMGDLFPKSKPAKKPKDRKPKPKPVADLQPDEWQDAWDAAKRLGPSSLTGFKLAAIYPYRHANGKTWGWRARYESKSGKKEIKPFHHNGTEWVLKEPKAPDNGKPLYRLSDVLATDGTIYVVEGEKCADALASIGIAATTSGAAKSAAKADFSVISGRACVIWPDNDAPGAQYAADVAEILQDNGCEVRVIGVEATGLTDEGADAADWLQANPTATAADVLALPTTEAAASGVQLVRASEIAPKAIDWLWSGYLARGMLTLIAGNGGTGKTTIALSIAAAITTGGKLPDGTTAPRGSVIMWSGEDALAEVLVPRLQEAGADLTRVHFVGNENGVFDPATDMPELERAARRIPDLALIILDPFASVVQGDSHKNSEVRRGVQPVLNLAAAAGATVIGITHFAKNTAGRSLADRVLGSVAFSAVARMVLGTVMGPDGEGRIVRGKTNIASTGDGFAYSIAVVNKEIDGRITQVSKIAWGVPLYGFADELLNQIESKRQPKDEAAEWLMAMLHSGPMPSKELQDRADADGIAWRTVERAKQALGIAAFRTGKGGPWSWRLPPNKHQ